MDHLGVSTISDTLPLSRLYKFKLQKFGDIKIPHTAILHTHLLSKGFGFAFKRGNSASQIYQLHAAQLYMKYSDIDESSKIVFLLSLGEPHIVSHLKYESVADI